MLLKNVFVDFFVGLLEVWICIFGFLVNSGFDWVGFKNSSVLYVDFITIAEFLL